MYNPKEVERDIVYLACMTISVFLLCEFVLVYVSNILIMFALISVNVVWLIIAFKHIWNLMKGLNVYHIQVFKVNMDAERELRENLVKKYEDE